MILGRTLDLGLYMRVQFHTDKSEWISTALTMYVDLSHTPFLSHTFGRLCSIGLPHTSHAQPTGPPGVIQALRKVLGVRVGFMTTPDTVHLVYENKYIVSA